MIGQQRHSVLVVEDERIVARDLQQTLTELGYDAFAIASSAEEAIARASDRRPDIVLIDVRIKGKLDGIETAALLRDRFSVAIVYLTAHADDVTLERAKATEPHGYLLKPVRSSELRSAIEIAVFKHEMERRVRERERWFSTTLRSIADGVVAVDLAGEVTFLNPAAELLTGVTAEEATGRCADQVLRLSAVGAAAAAPTALAMALLADEPVAPQEAVLENLATGAKRLIAERAAPVLDASKRLGAVMVFRDVTDQKRLQKQLELAGRLASLGTLAAGVAHEINNPLNIVTGNADFLTAELSRHRTTLEAVLGSGPEGAGASDLFEALTDMQTAAGRIVRIVADLRVFSQQPAQPDEDVADLIDCVRFGIRATAREFSERARVRAHLGEVPRVRGDDVRLGQVVVNLLLNAAHACRPGDPDLHAVDVTTRTGDDGRAVLEIRDTGAGIPKEVLARIFEPFFTTKAVGEGTGLGLSICHGIVEGLGGELTIESQPGKGTLARVVLPPVASGCRDHPR